MTFPLRFASLLCLSAAVTGACADDPALPSDTTTSGGGSADGDPNGTGGSGAGDPAGVVASGGSEMTAGAPGMNLGGAGNQACQQCDLAGRVSVRSAEADPVILGEVPRDATGEPASSGCGDRVQLHRSDCKGRYGSVLAAASSETSVPNWNRWDGWGGAPYSHPGAALSLHFSERYETGKGVSIEGTGAYIDEDGVDWELVLDPTASAKEALSEDLLRYDAGPEVQQTLKFIGTNPTQEDRIFTISIATCTTIGPVCLI